MKRYCFGILILAFLIPTSSSAQLMVPQEPGYVIQVEGRLVFIDRGMEDDIEPEDLLQVVRQETIIHPVTGENLGGQVPLGAVRIVEVFPKLSTAEIVELVVGMDMNILDQEAKQGMIRVQELPIEIENVMKERMAEPTYSMTPVLGNPDGVLGRLNPNLTLGFGSRPPLTLPTRAYQLIRPDIRFSDLQVGQAVGIPEGSIALVADSLLLAFADTLSVSQELPELGSQIEVGLDFEYPITTWLSGLADLRFGNRTQISLGARAYPGKSLFGKGFSPDGNVGQPVVSLSLG